MILLVQSYPGGNETAARHAPYWEKQGFSAIYGIGTNDGLCQWAEGIIPVQIGQDSYINGDILCRRLIDTIAFGLSRKEWRIMAIIEYDTVLFKPFSTVISGVLNAVICGGRPHQGFKCSQFLHNPWVSDRIGWKRILSACKECLSSGEIEGGSPDCFLGWACEKHQITFAKTFDLYTQNTIVTDAHIEQARNAYRSGVTAIHGIKSDDVLKKIIS